MGGPKVYWSAIEGLNSIPRILTTLDYELADTTEGKPAGLVEELDRIAVTKIKVTPREELIAPQALEAFFKYLQSNGG